MLKRALAMALVIASPGTQVAVPALLLAQSTPAEARATCDADSYIISKGHCVPKPRSAPSAPPGATAKCRDGTYSFSESRRGTCSHHGGVDRWI